MVNYLFLLEFTIYISHCAGLFCYDCYAAPTDGACHDESCLCFNQIEESGISLSLFIMLIGILTSVLLIIFNFHNRNNK